MPLQVFQGVAAKKETEGLDIWNFTNGLFSSQINLVSIAVY